MPRLRVLAGPDPSSLTPISTTVNSGTPHRISSDLFEGQVIAHIQGFTDEQGKVRDSEYFGREDRKNVTWSIQVQGESFRSLISSIFLSRCLCVKSDGGGMVAT